MQSMIVSQQQLMRRKPNEFAFSSSPSSNNGGQNTNRIPNKAHTEKSSDEKKTDVDSEIPHLNSISDAKQNDEDEAKLSNPDDQPFSYPDPNSKNSINQCPSSLESSNRSKKSSNWFNFLPTYKVRAEEFKKYFGHIVPSNERFVVDYSCAYQREILAQGRMYISLNYICFHANIFSWETNLVIKCKDIKQIYKANTALIIPNAIEILTDTGDKYFFASYVTRGRAFSMLYKIWQNSLSHIKSENKNNSERNRLSISEDLIWNLIHEAYGSDLGYTEEEEKQEKLIKADSSCLENKTSAYDTDSSSDSDLYLDSDAFYEMNSKSKTMSQETKYQSLENGGDHHSQFTCDCGSHDGVKLFDETFSLTVDQLFTLAFDDSPFYRMVQKINKTIINSLEPWHDTDERTPDDETKKEQQSLKKMRDIRYVLQLDNPFAKSANVLESQLLSEKSVPGQCYMIESLCHNSGVPFSDTFQVRSQYCVTRGPTIKECNLKVHSRVEWIKSGFGLSLMKSAIESSSMKGISDYFKFLSKQLNNWCKEKSLERRHNLNHFQQFKQLEYQGDSSDEDNVEDDDDFVLSNDRPQNEEPSSNKTNSINRKVFDAKRKLRFTSASSSSVNSTRNRFSKQQIQNHSSTSSIWKFKNNELILFIIFIILLFILVLILFLFKRLWQLEIIIRKYEEDLMSFEQFMKFTSDLSDGESFSNVTVHNLAETWRDLIKQTESTIKSMRSIYLEKTTLD